MNAVQYNIFLFTDIFLISKQNVEDKRKSIKKKDVIPGPPKLNYIDKIGLYTRKIRQVMLFDH